MRVIGPNHAVLREPSVQRRAIGGVDLIQINTQASPGSPVLNEHGKVIGLIVKRAAGVNAASRDPQPLHFGPARRTPHHVLRSNVGGNRTRAGPAFAIKSKNLPRGISKEHVWLFRSTGLARVAIRSRIR